MLNMKFLKGLFELLQSPEQRLLNKRYRQLMNVIPTQHKGE